MSTQSTSITIESAAQEHRLAIKSMLHAYLSELGASTDYPYFDLYWQDKTRFPYLIRLGPELAGFALVRMNERARFEIAEFCVFAGFRRSGAGSAAAAAIFLTHPGEWEVRGFPGNHIAAAFWDHAITAGAGNVCQSIEDGVPVFHFSVSASISKGQHRDSNSLRPGLQR
jgi:predicted acetyltransferase